MSSGVAKWFLSSLFQKLTPGFIHYYLLFTDNMYFLDNVYFSHFPCKRLKLNHFNFLFMNIYMYFFDRAVRVYYRDIVLAKPKAKEHA